jgi:hypothetical protein
MHVYYTINSAHFSILLCEKADKEATFDFYTQNNKHESMGIFVFLTQFFLRINKNCDIITLEW